MTNEITTGKECENYDTIIIAFVNGVAINIYSDDWVLKNGIWRLK